MILEASLIVESTVHIVMWQKSTVTYSTPYSRLFAQNLRYFVVVSVWVNFSVRVGREVIFVVLEKFLRVSVNDNFLFLGFSPGVGVLPGL